MRADTKFIKQIKQITKSQEFQSKHVKEKINFSRKRKLSFTDMIMYTIGNTRSPICLEAERFSTHIGEEITGAALCKARQKIEYTAFQELFEITAQTAPRTNKYHVDYTKERMKNSHVKSNGICEFDLRCVRIQLKSEEEILITNLAREAFPKRDIKELYRLRWDIETGFNYLKCSICGRICHSYRKRFEARLLCFTTDL